jgi:hypothetical protein
MVGEEVKVMSGVLLTVIMIAVMIVAGGLVLVAEMFLSNRFAQLPEWSRWLLFLPISFVLAFLVVVVFYIGTTYVWTMNENFQLIVQWVLAPIILFYTIFKTIPRAKKSVTITLTALWLALRIWEMITVPKNLVVGIIQSVALALFIFYVASNQISPKQE